MSMYAGVEPESFCSPDDLFAAVTDFVEDLRSVLPRNFVIKGVPWHERQLNDLLMLPHRPGRTVPSGWTVITTGTAIWRTVTGSEVDHPRAFVLRGYEEELCPTKD